MKTRKYRMGLRAESAAATGERILDATQALFWEDPAREATLAEIAARAGVSAQTVLRRFGTRDGVEAATMERGLSRVGSQRDNAVAGDVPGAVEVLLDHYEEVGDRVMHMIAAEHRREAVGNVVQRGREAHVAWCERVFADALKTRRGAARARRLAQFVAICDVYTWKVLRRDRGLSRAQTQRALLELLEPLLEEN